MNGNDTVKYLKSKYQEGQDYGHISIIIRKKMIQVWHVAPAMAQELKSLGFVEEGYAWSKAFEPAAEPQGATLSSGWTIRPAKINWDVEDYVPEYMKGLE